MTIQLNPAVLEHNQATANLFVSGLCILHFDINRRVWEINFLRNSDHTFTLNISGNGYNVSEEVGERLEVTTVDGIAPDWNQFPNGYWFSNERFNRGAAQGHDEDFRWVPDLANNWEFLLHGRPRRKPRLGPTIDSITKVELANVLFYTWLKTGYNLTLALGRVPSPIPFGETNETVGADIVCKAGGAIVIKLNGKEYRLPHVPNSPYTIELENTDSNPHQPPPPERIIGDFLLGDFYLYYDFVDVKQPIGFTYDVVCRLKLFKSDDCDCNPAFVSSFV
jgi:hypothetical protein